MRLGSTILCPMRRLHVGGWTSDKLHKLVEFWPPITIREHCVTMGVDCIYGFSGVGSKWADSGLPGFRVEYRCSVCLWTTWSRSSMAFAGGGIAHAAPPHARLSRVVQPPPLAPPSSPPLPPGETRRFRRRRLHPRRRRRWQWRRPSWWPLPPLAPLSNPYVWPFAVGGVLLGFSFCGSCCCLIGMGAETKRLPRCVVSTLGVLIPISGGVFWFVLNPVALGHGVDSHFAGGAV